MQTDLSLVAGETRSPLSNATLGDVGARNDRTYGSKIFLHSPYQNQHLTFSQLYKRSRAIAKGLLAAGLVYGDHVGVYLPNCIEHVEVFLACGIIGLPMVSFNITFTPDDLARAAAFTDVKAIFICASLQSKPLTQHVQKLLSVSALELLIHVGTLPARPQQHRPRPVAYEDFTSQHNDISDADFAQAASLVTPQTILNIQFTSGTTGFPKAALLTHYGMLNNADLCSRLFQIQSSDISLGCPPLFHCMGSIGTFLTAFMAGASLVFASPVFVPAAALDAIVDYKVTIVNGVPTMFLAIAEVARQRGLAGKIKSLRTGFVAGAPTSKEIVALMSNVLGMHEPVIGYGLTETSMCVTATGRNDAVDKKTTTCGKIVPHYKAKIVAADDANTTLPKGQRGELLVAGYGVIKGYYRQPEKTNETIITDAQGERWVRTGDEAMFDSDDYCIITGRIKDIIIRGGENIYPAEIEQRLALLPGIAEASVIGVPDAKYGEVVAAFVRADTSDPAVERPTDEQVRKWVTETLAWQKAPRFMFWMGHDGLPDDFPKTGSGKHQKHILRELAAVHREVAPLKARI